MKKKTCRQILYCVFLAVLILMGLFMKKKSDRTQAVSSYRSVSGQTEAAEQTESVEQTEAAE